MPSVWCAGALEQHTRLPLQDNARRDGDRLQGCTAYAKAELRMHMFGGLGCLRYTEPAMLGLRDSGMPAGCASLTTEKPVAASLQPATGPIGETSWVVQGSPVHRTHRNARTTAPLLRNGPCCTALLSVGNALHVVDLCGARLLLSTWGRRQSQLLSHTYPRACQHCSGAFFAGEAWGISQMTA